MQEEIPNGYRRVSDILSIFQNWAKVPQSILKRAQDLGTNVHEAIEAHLMDRWHPMEENVEKYLESWKIWFSTIPTMTILFTETRFNDPILMITGKPDLICEIDGKKTIVDFKTGSTLHPEIWRLQGTFYRYLLERERDIAINKFLFMKLHKDGSAPLLFPMEYRESDWTVCREAIRAYEYFKEIKKLYENH